MTKRRKTRKSLQKQKVIQYSKLEKKVAVIWTRVSSYEQEKNGCGLDFQKKICREYAKRHNITVKYEMGDTYETAKVMGDGFNNMIATVAKDKEVNMILVHSFDRFSRTGEEAIAEKAYLKSKGIYVISATQETDPDSAAGELMQNLLFLFAQFDNQLRRDKCITGMVECLRKGQWYSKPPIGYSKHREGKEHILTVNPQGEILRNAFIWKANEPNISDYEIIDRLNDLGLTINRKTLNDSLHNKLYCGLIESPLLDEGEIVPFNDKQEILIDKETWDRANGITRCGYEHAEETPETPLKRHIRCSKCGCYLTGYSRIKRNKKGEERTYFYYKCNTKGCGVNLSAKEVHNRYVDMLNSFKIPQAFMPILTKRLHKIFAEFTNFKKERNSHLKKRKSELENLIKKAQVNRGIGEISDEVYQTTIDELRTKLAEVETGLAQEAENLSNRSKFIDQVLATVSKLGDFWTNGNFRDRQKIQNLVYPEGIYYDKDSEAYRTDSVNSALDVFRKFSESCERVKEKADSELLPNLPLVEHTRLELVTS